MKRGLMWTLPRSGRSCCCNFSIRSPRLARLVERDRLPNERFECGFVDLFSFADVDRAASVSVQARVEETGRILQRRTFGEGQFHGILVRFTGADDPVVRPSGRA